MTSKVCSKCKEEKPLEAFNKNRSNRDGLQSQCKVCGKQYYQESREKRLEYAKQHHQENREKRLEYAKQYYQDNREQQLEYKKQWRQSNIEYMKQWRQENREQQLEYKKQYYQDNVEKYTAYSMKRRALKQDSIPEALLNCPIEKDRLEKIYKLRSLLTEATGVEYHVDHIWPLSKGGPHWSGNLQVIPAEENLSKSDSFCEDTARVIQESLDDYIQSIRH